MRRNCWRLFSTLLLALWFFNAFPGLSFSPSPLLLMTPMDFFEIFSVTLVLVFFVQFGMLWISSSIHTRLYFPFLPLCSQHSIQFSVLWKTFYFTYVASLNTHVSLPVWRHQLAISSSKNLFIDLLNRSYFFFSAARRPVFCTIMFLILCISLEKGF